MSEHIAKRSRLSMEEELDNEESQPMQEGSDDEFEDITYTEKERDAYELDTETEPRDPSLLLTHSCVLSPEAPCVFPPPSPPEVARPTLRVVSPPEVARPTPRVVSPPDVARPTPRVVSPPTPRVVSPPEVASPDCVVSSPEVASPTPRVVSPPEVARPTPRAISTHAPVWQLEHYAVTNRYRSLHTECWSYSGHSTFPAGNLRPVFY